MGPNSFGRFCCCFGEKSPEQVTIANVLKSIARERASYKGKIDCLARTSGSGLGRDAFDLVGPNLFGRFCCCFGEKSPEQVTIANVLKSIARERASYRSKINRLACTLS